jgi:WhiB family transcriptional regulator, redox-sensing transcriptional regulator
MLSGNQALLTDDPVDETYDARPARVLTPTDHAFVRLALCVGRTELFFPPYNERPSTRARREVRAKQLCGRCPVADDCRAFARRHGEYGLWGGETDEERVLAGVRLRYPYSPKTIKRERQQRLLDGAEPDPSDLEAVEAWLRELDLAS